VCLQTGNCGCAGLYVLAVKLGEGGTRPSSKAPVPAHLTGGVGRTSALSSATSFSTQGANTCAGRPAHHSLSSLLTCSGGRRWRGEG
jgi:hypothetical protein